jgi:predicted GIY-YIG superfamily endonuclease
MAYKKTGYYLVYKVTFPNGKLYIGYTSTSLYNRKLSHISEVRRGKNRKFYNALKKYGNSAEWEIINTYQNQDFALSREIYFINKFNTYNSNFGYNMTLGGEGKSGPQKGRTSYIDNFGNVYSGLREIFEKLGFCKNQVLGSTLKGYYCGNYFFSKYEDGMLVALKRTSLKKKSDRARKIHCTINQTCFSSLKEASEFLNVMPQAIYRVVVGSRNHVKGYYLRYIEDN